MKYIIIYTILRKLKELNGQIRVGIKMITNCSSAMITSLDGCTGTGNWFVILIVCVTAAIVLAVALGAFKDKK